MYLPILNANIIDSITTSNSFDEIYSRFKQYISFLLLRIFTFQFLNIFEYFLVTSENTKYKNILLEKIIKKDILFFDIFKTGELVEKIEKSDEFIEQDFITKIIFLIQNIIKLLLMCYYLYKTSFKLALITTIVLLLKAFSDFLNNKYTKIYNFEERDKAKESYTNLLTELFYNIRMIKSFCKEEEEIKKILKFKKMSRFNNNIVSILMFNFAFFVKKGGEAFTLLFAGKYI